MNNLKLYSLFLFTLISINGCITYQPMNTICSGYEMQVVEYTRLCSKSTFNTWQNCSAQAERLFCQNPDWKGK